MEKSQYWHGFYVVNLEKSDFKYKFRKMGLRKYSFDGFKFK